MRSRISCAQGSSRVVSVSVGFVVTPDGFSMKLYDGGRKSSDGLEMVLRNSSDGLEMSLLGLIHHSCERSL